MKAWICEEFGPPDVLKLAEVPEPLPAPGEVRIRVYGSAVNFPDLLMVAGKYQLKPPFPFSPGIEAAGVIEALGAGVKGYAVGDRVMARLDIGGFAEKVCAPVARLVKMPDNMDFDSAAAFIVSYGTNYHALAERGNLRVGEYLLVLGATGGVGISAVELGRAMGAIVIAAGGSDEKLKAARDYGADFLINYGREDIRARVKEITNGTGADVVYDAVGGDATDQAVRSLAFGARVLVIGFAAGTIPNIPANRLLIKSASAVGVLWGLHAERFPDSATETYRRLTELYRHGRLKPAVSKVVPFAEAPSALKAMADRSVIGRVVIRMQEETA